MTRKELDDMKAAVTCLGKETIGIHMLSHAMSLLVPIIVRYERELDKEDEHWTEQERAG